MLWTANSLVFLFSYDDCNFYWEITIPIVVNCDRFYVMVAICIDFIARR
jgi:hypothetical protein